MQSNWDNAFKMMLASEGGYVNHPSDPGGMTNLGVTKRVWEEWVGRESNEKEMRSLTLRWLSRSISANSGMPVSATSCPAGLTTWCLISL